MRALDPATAAALESGRIVPRDFLWLVPRDRDTGAARPMGFWSDLGGVEAIVIDPVTDLPIAREYSGAGDLISVGAVPLATGFAVQTVPITLSQITPGAAMAVRGYDLRRALVELHRGYLDPDSGLLVAPAQCWFTGEIDAAPITTPAEGEEGAITLTAVSHAQELSRTNPAKRSDADQRQRSPGDGFYRHAATVGSWTITWGQESET